MTDHPTTDLVPPPPEIQGDAARAVPVTVAQMAAARAFLLTTHDLDEVTHAAAWRHAANAVLARRAIEGGLELPEGTLDVPSDTAPAEPVPGLSLNGDDGINARLCRALGVDPGQHVGYRLTVMGGEFPAMEVFQLPPMTGDGMFSDSGPIALEDLIADGARIVPPHLALSEFALAKLLDAHTTLQNLCASPVATDGDELAELRRQQFWAFSALEAALSGWAEAGSPEPKVVAVVSGVIDEHGVSFTADTPDDIGVEVDTEVECYLIPVLEPSDVDPSEQPVPPADTPEAR